MRSILSSITTILLTGLLIGGGYALFAHQTTPLSENYRAAAHTVLTDAHVDFQTVEIIDGCAPTPQLCRSYAGIVRVQADRTLTGQIACRERWTTCTLTLQEAGIVAAPLPDVIDPVAWRWEQLQGAIMRWVQGVR